MLIANAGSGKTHALTTRVIRLLALGVEPRKIAALTFTRKAAGELLSTTFLRLAKSAIDSAALAELRENEGLEQLDACKCGSLLAALAQQIGELGMGTIDSLFARIARAFPLECGLSDDFRIAPEAEIETAREKALAMLFQSESHNSEHLSAFIELLRRITRRHGERDVFETLRRSVENLHATYLATPSSVVWGDASSIWRGAECRVLNAGSLPDAAMALIAGIERDLPNLDPAALEKWRSDCSVAAAHSNGALFQPNLKTFFKKLSNVKADPNGQFYIPTGNARAARLYLVEQIPELLEQLKLALARPVFEDALTRSRALHDFMRRFEMVYSTRVRSSGIVTFSDITDLLSCRAEQEDWRLAVGYRLDQQFDHWLLDEFQDTSRPQWSVLRAFIEEILMDPSGSRSFFYVGDTKQAIYSWRGGDAGLFREIFDDFQGALQEAPALTQSYRSSPPILDFVNAVFENPAALAEPLRLPASTVEKWLHSWRRHEPSPRTQNRIGHVRWLAVEEEEGASDDSVSPEDLQILQILQQTEPWMRGISCGILRRDNKGLAALAGLLQANGIPMALEGRMNPCVDNPLGAAFLAALRAVASPEDRLSQVIASGFSELSALGMDKPLEFRSRTLACIAGSGFATLFRGWIKEVDFNNEPLLVARGSELLLAAEEFDLSRKPSDGISEFLLFLEKRQTQEVEASGVVRLMTIHQAKGLGFDMVICSGLDSRGPNNRTDKVALGPDLKKTAWGIVMPPADFLESDPQLRKRAEELESDERLGEICTAYVALTRAKTALYLVTTRLKESTTSTNFARWLTLALGSQGYESGDAEWFASNPKISTRQEKDQISTSPVFHPPIHGTPRAKTPSSAKTSPFENGGNVSTGANPDAVELGIEIHAALARVEWMDAAPLGFSDLSEEAQSLLGSFFKRPEAKEVFSKPETPHALWREQAFDVKLDGEWVGGVFDRVLLHLDETGQPASAVIFDFKTDNANRAEIESRYAAQMETYRHALCVITKLQANAVETRLIAIR